MTASYPDDRNPSLSNGTCFDGSVAIVRVDGASTDAKDTTTVTRWIKATGPDTIRVEVDE